MRAYCQQKLIWQFAALGIILAVVSCESGSEIKKTDLVALHTARTLGLAYLEENRPEEALQQFYKLIDIAPDQAIGYANAGLVELRNGNNTTAGELLEKALQLDRNNPDIRLLMAELMILRGQDADAHKLLSKSVKTTPNHIKSLFKLVSLPEKSSPSQSPADKIGLLRRLVELAPGNLVARLKLTGAYLQDNNRNLTAEQMMVLFKQIPLMPENGRQYFDQTLAAIQAGNMQTAAVQLQIFHNVLKSSPLYQYSVVELQGYQSSGIGQPVLRFTAPVSQQISDSLDTKERLAFVDASQQLVDSRTRTQLSPPEQISAVRSADMDGDGDEDLVVAFWIKKYQKASLKILNNNSGKFDDISDKSVLIARQPINSLLIADFDNDALLDIYVVSGGNNHLCINQGDGRFSDATARSNTGDDGRGRIAQAFDADHDGDLDILLGNEKSTRLFRNNFDGSFSDATAQAGLDARASAIAAAYSDIDEDGDLDFLLLDAEHQLQFFNNQRSLRFLETSAASKLTGGRFAAFNIVDLDYDGLFDILVAPAPNGLPRIFLNQGGGTFRMIPDAFPATELSENLNIREIKTADFDNDGFSDVLVSYSDSQPEQQSGLALLHGNSDLQFKKMAAVSGTFADVEISDFDNDGDPDIIAIDNGQELRLLRNDGGNAKRFLKITLNSLSKESGKMNYYGIGSKLEIRAGLSYQVRTVEKTVTMVGLGQNQKADAVRILWTNGVPQNVIKPGSNQRIVEKQVLKGSCPFLYAWNGQEFSFVTDILWRSALGMPLGIMGGTTTYAFADAADEYLKIPGDKLLAKDDLYTLQVTEELWETAFIDQFELIAVDHPDSLEVYIGEQFTGPPPFPELKIYPVSKKILPRSASDDRGNDVLEKLTRYDNSFVDHLMPTRYQGIVELHDLVLDFGVLSDDRPALLFLNGWIFPTDASINVAVAQSDSFQLIPPVLQVPDPNGEWQTVASIGFPKGKNKTVIVDLNGKFLSSDHRLRLRTNMQIYWNHAFLSFNSPDVPMVRTIVNPLSADLHYRGFSQLYRKTPDGPHLFDYQKVDKTVAWRDLEGLYTRYGDVLSLLLESDDHYVIMNAGDEITLNFDAKQLPDLPEGWRRDFLIYNDGWVKDGDLNTAYGQTVAPLPSQRMSTYPYQSGEQFFDTPQLRTYVQSFNTREVTSDAFRNFHLKQRAGTAKND